MRNIVIKLHRTADLSGMMADGKAGGNVGWGYGEPSATRRPTPSPSAPVPVRHTKPSSLNGRCADVRK